MTGLWAEDDDRRGEDMVENPKRYFATARVQAERDVTANRRPSRSGSKPSTLGPNIVEMSLRGADGDVERLVTKMREAGIVVWRRNTRGTRSGNAAGYWYFVAEVPPEG